MNSLIIAIVSALLSGLVATCISNHYYTRMLEKKRKTNFVQNFFGYRYELAKGQNNRKEINFLLGQVPIVFNNNKCVLENYKNYLAESTQDNATNLLKSMCSDRFVDVKLKHYDTRIYEDIPLAK